MKGNIYLTARRGGAPCASATLAAYLAADTEGLGRHITVFKHIHSASLIFLSLLSTILPIDAMQTTTRG